MRSPSKTLEITALFAAFSIFLSTLEYMIPKPVPFLRLGLANLPILLSIEVFPIVYVFILIILKVIGQGLVNGTLFSYIFLFSLAGSVAGGMVMIGARKILKERISLIGVSVLGALASNTVQLGVASLLILGKGAILLAPPLVGTGLLSSFLLGLFAKEFLTRSVWIQTIRETV
ncbi:MAG: heptaprenyl diphosphate synthase [Spirochaetes bacterium]|nr:MAG: heptaprenyl diphosphate synthase [Spirochaetota bacterium]